MKNLEKRRRIMRRSMRLGHCVCDPQSLPLRVFRNQDVARGRRAAAGANRADPPYPTGR